MFQCYLEGVPGSRMPVARSQDRTRARVAASRVNPSTTEHRDFSWDLKGTGWVVVMVSDKFSLL